MIVLRALGFLWLFPVTLLSWIFFCVPYWLRGAFEKVEMFSDFVIIWDVKNVSKFGRKEMKSWYGFVLGANVICIDTPNVDPEKQNLETFNTYIGQLKHEVYHVFQQYVLGIFFYPVYIAIALFIWLFLKNKHPYFDHPLEKQANRYAGLPETVPEERRGDAPHDRWPWW